MIRATFTIPDDLWMWLRGYAAARKVSRSRVVSDLLIEKRVSFAHDTKKAEMIRQLAKRIHCSS